MANGKDIAMNAKANKRSRNRRGGAYEWLTTTMRNGRRRIEVLGWKRLAAIYLDARPGSPVRKAIEREARRCGYTPRVILAIHA